ncbi:lipid-binding protein [Rubrolithibacter danxiaensis]|uniref:lipid-binding protein n=1 Tax=Rubrolithibacter danxiaensis TaxID=3390805 RepID=UPI003BF778E8
MKRSKILYTVITALFIVFLGSCQKDPEVGGTATQALAGDWFVQWKELPGTYFHFTTYNTAANSQTEMWLDDNYSFWSSTGDEQLKGKVTVNASSLSFSGDNIANVDPNMPITFSIKNGKVIPNGAKGPGSNAPTDSIYFEAEFSDDPGTTYIISGYRRTGFDADEQ